MCERNSNTNCVVNVKHAEINYELGQNLSELQIYPNLAENSESESLAEESQRISWKVDFNVVSDPNILLGLINNGENVCFFNPVIQILYSLPVFRDYIIRLWPPVKGVAMEIRKRFSKIQTSSDMWGHLIMWGI